MLAYMVARVVRDFALLFIFAYPLWPRLRVRMRQRTAVAVGAICVSLAIAVVYSLVVGRGGLVDAGASQVPIKILCFWVAYYIVFRYAFGLTPKVSQLESLILLIALRAGQMLWSELAVPLMTETVGTIELGEVPETLFVAVVDLVFVLALAPRGDEIDEESVSLLQLVLLAFTLVYYLVMKLAYQESSTLAVNWSIFLNGIECVCLFVFCYVVKRTVAENYHRNQVNRMNMLVEREYAHILQRQKDDHRMRVLYHDVRQALSLLHPAEVDAVMDSFSSVVGAVSSVPYTKHPVLNMLLNQKAEEAAERDIRLTIATNFGDCSFIDDYDVITMFGNMLTNAFEAVEALPDGVDRWVSFEAAQHRSLLVVLVRNPYRTDAHPRDPLGSTKRGTGRHGLGLSSIEACAKTYGGLFKVDAGDEVFSAAVSLPIPSACMHDGPTPNGA